MSKTRAGADADELRREEDVEKDRRGAAIQSGGRKAKTREPGRGDAHAANDRFCDGYAGEFGNTGTPVDGSAVASVHPFDAERPNDSVH